MLRDVVEVRVLDGYRVFEPLRDPARFREVSVDSGHTIAWPNGADIGGNLPATKSDAALVRAGKRRFLVHGNYDALLRYNCAHHYALSVAILADRIE